MAVTIKEIADKLGISISTVSKGLNGANDISEDLRQKVLDTAVEMGYKTKRMRKEGHKKLAIFVKNMEYKKHDDFGYDLILGFEQMAYREKWTVKTIFVTDLMQLHDKYETYMLKNGFSGAFLLGFSLVDEWMNQLSQTSIPTALLDNYVRKSPCVAYVGTDSDEGFDMAIDHLIRLGHTRIAFLNGEKDSMITKERQNAYESHLIEHGINPDPALMAYGEYSTTSARYHVPDFLKEGATAIMCGNDLIAMGVVEECEKAGYKVPRDISVIGYDDLPPAANFYPPLTTIRQDRLELGKSAFFTLSSLINHVAIGKTMLRPQFIARNSTTTCNPYGPGKRG